MERQSTFVLIPPFVRKPLVRTIPLRGQKYQPDHDNQSD